MYVCHGYFSLVPARGDTVAPSGLYARLCHAFLVFKNFWSPVMLGWLICIVVPNFIKIGTVAEISHLTIFKMMAVRHLGLFL